MLLPLVNVVLVVFFAIGPTVQAKVDDVVL